MENYVDPEEEKRKANEAAIKIQRWIRECKKEGKFGVKKDGKTD